MNRLNKEYNKKLNNYLNKEIAYIDCVNSTDNNNSIVNADNQNIKDCLFYLLFMIVIGVLPIIYVYVRLCNYYGLNNLVD